MTPINYCYFNFYQDAPAFHPLSWAGYIPLEKVYAYTPLPDSLNTEEKKHIIGIQANVWTEDIPTEANAETMIWPRLLAIAETGWPQPDHKSYPAFRKNALRAVQNLQARGYHPFDLKNEKGQRTEYADTMHHLAYGKPVNYREPFDREYTAGGYTALTDGLQGGWSPADHRWQRYLGKGICSGGSRQ